jgi:hypothetical protein
VIALLPAVVNAHIVYQVQVEKQKTRAELWVMPERAHLKAPGRDVFWDLAKERRLDLSGGRRRDEPISFSRMVRKDELFPRGLRLGARGTRRVLGRTCRLYSHKQDVPTGDGDERAQLTWCIWQGVPLSLDYAESVCRRGRCRNSKARWRATQVTTGAAKDEDVKRP